MSQGARKAALSQEEESLSEEVQSLHNQLKVRISLLSCTHTAAVNVAACMRGPKKVLKSMCEGRGGLCRSSNRRLTRWRGDCKR